LPPYNKGELRMNMSYCRFENTLNDLRDCANNLYDEPESKSEQRARLALIELCVEIANDFGDEIEESN